MKKINIDLSRFRKEEKKTEEWKELAKEISDYYGVKLYWLVAPWREQVWYVRSVLKQCQNDSKPVHYFIKILKLKEIHDSGNMEGK